MIQGKSISGLSYAIKKTSGKAACCAISINCGTRAEGDLPEGIAHFVEHCVFKGTDKHSARSISQILDKLGGELNAYTTKEEIVLHATVLKEDIYKAISLLLEIATQATFPEDEIQTEKGVVIDEIISYLDSPSEDIYDNFESRFFEGHPLGRLTLGTEESIKGARRQDLVDYYRTYFTPSRMVLSVVADIDEKKMEKKVCSLIGKYCTASKPDSSEESLCTYPSPNFFSIREDKDNHEANLIIGSLAPSLYDENERICCVLLANILGGPAGNSLLNAELREKHGWVYAAECNYTQYKDAGLVTISVGCDKDNLTKCIKAISKILDKLKESPMSEKAMKEAKKQLSGQLAISSDSKESQALSMGKSMLAYGRVASDDEHLKRINAISPEDIRQMAQRLWEEGHYSQLLYL